MNFSSEWSVFSFDWGKEAAPMIHLAIVTLIYFLPTVIAAHRGHVVGGVAVLNFFIGWTGVGWLALLVWALVSRPPFYGIPVHYADGYWRRW